MESLMGVSSRQKKQQLRRCMALHGRGVYTDHQVLPTRGGMKRSPANQGSGVNLHDSKSGGREIRSQKFSISSEKIPIFKKKFDFSRQKIPMTFFSHQCEKVSFPPNYNFYRLPLHSCLMYLFFLKITLQHPFCSK